jgi:hypothetical protein
MPCYARVSVSSEGEQHSDTGCCVVGQGVWTGFYWAQRKQEVKKAAAHGPRNEGLTSLSPGSDFFQLTRAGHRLGVDLQSGDLGPNLGVVPRRELLWQRSTMWFELWFPGAVLFNTNEVLNNPLLSPVTQASLGGLRPLLIVVSFLVWRRFRLPVGENFFGMRLCMSLIKQRSQSNIPHRKSISINIPSKRRTWGNTPAQKSFYRCLTIALMYPRGPNINVTLGYTDIILYKTRQVHVPIHRQFRYSMYFQNTPTSKSSINLCLRLRTPNPNNPPSHHNPLNRRPP